MIISDSVSRAEADGALISLLSNALLGELSAGLLHEINNPITAILNYARLLQMHHFQPEEVEEFAKNIVDEGERIAELTNRITHLARPQPVDGRGANLKDTLVLAVHLYSTRFRHDGIVVEFQSNSALPDTKLPIASLLQIVLPLLEQARRSLRSCAAGNKTIRCRWDEFIVEGRNWHRLSLIHNGVPPTDASVNLFHHLFTGLQKKEQEKLAATMTKALITKLDCKIEIESPIDGWTAMYLDLPVEKQG